MAVNLYLDARASKGESPIKASVSFRSKSFLVPLGVKVLPSQWDAEKRSVIKHKMAKELNTFLSHQKSRIEIELIRFQEIGDKSASAKDYIMSALYPERKVSVTFISRFRHFMSFKTKTLTHQSYDWTLHKLTAFDPAIESRSFEDITTDYLKNFIRYNSALAPNSVNILLRNIRAVFNDAIDAGITSFYPFRKLPMRPEKTMKKALTYEQIRLLFSYACEPCQVEYRDMFKLMFFLRGVNAIDLFSAKLTQVVNGRFEYRRSKVGTPFSVKIEPEALEIINRYKGKDYLLSPLDRYANYRDYLHHMNDALKSIGAVRGKNRVKVSSGLFPKLSSNWARHSWATIGINLDIPKETIRVGMGHGTNSVTDIYIDFDMKKVDEANRKIIDYVLKP